MIPISVSLSHYKRSDIQEEIIANSRDREIAIKFNESFGKRPDVLRNNSDILELAKQGATSFHASEELWKNPLQIDVSMKRHELDNLRIGWDLVLDVDCPIWEYSKVITAFIIQALKENGLNSISCKFSGNKGFHIGVPFEAFPSTIDRKDTRLLFPDGVKIIVSFLINEEIDKRERLTNFILKNGLDDLISKTQLPKTKLIKNFCDKCKLYIEYQKEKFEYICTKCLSNKISDENIIDLKCQKCDLLMIKKVISKNVERSDISNKEYIQICYRCKNRDLKPKLDLKSMLHIDTLLISSRHLYRMPYSLHEKSGLVSIPLNPDKVLLFKKEFAIPNNVKVSKYRFLDKESVKSNEASALFDKAFSWSINSNKELQTENIEYLSPSSKNKKSEFEIKKPLTEELFPPCIKLILNGIEDGKKRALLILINYFNSIGWDYYMIEKKLNEWNNKNKTPLREVYLLGQLRYNKQINKKILPPNCNNEMYMKGIGVCKPDNFCPRIKNPAQYTTKKAWLMDRGKGKSIKKLFKANTKA